MILSATFNALLETLPIKDRTVLYGQGETVSLVLNEVLCDVDVDTEYVYFPLTGFISLVVPTKGHAPLETGLVGNEGMLGATLILDVSTAPARGVVQGSGTALRFTSSEFCIAMKNHPGLRRSINRYLYVLIAQQSYAITCTHFHEVESRLARWLLMIHDRTSGNLLQLTHSFLADMLGVQRSAVTIAAGHLQKQNLISYSRGKIKVIDRLGLEGASCECYEGLSADYISQFPYAKV
ncbi:MAG: CRP-like cAMP-binding protein [Cyclobacteriaceae bacterium]|jgi:CRP-like cAMP-binding protein